MQLAKVVEAFVLVANPLKNRKSAGIQNGPK